MVFLVRKLRTDLKLRRFKIVVVTDRKDLQNQLSATAKLTGENVEIATSSKGAQELVRRKGPGLLFVTIQKYRETDDAVIGDDEDETSGGVGSGTLKHLSRPEPSCWQKPMGFRPNRKPSMRKSFAAYRVKPNQSSKHGVQATFCAL